MAFGRKRSVELQEESPSFTEEVRPGGPRDVSEVELSGEWLDFGGLMIAPVEGLEVQVQVDEGSARVQMITCVLGQAAAQMHAFAAPRTAGIWDEIRSEIKAGIIAAGGHAEEAQGPFGTELQAQLPQEGGAAQSARFIGVDGPRWFFRAILLGDAAVPGPGATAIEEMVRGVVVVRGDAAMAPRELLPMHVPGQAPAPAETAVLNPFVRGPEITEIR